MGCCCGKDEIGIYYLCKFILFYVLLMITIAHFLTMMIQYFYGSRYGGGTDTVAAQILFF